MTTPSEAHLGFLDFESDEIWAYGLLAHDAWHDERRVLRVARTVQTTAGELARRSPGMRETWMCRRS